MDFAPILARIDRLKPWHALGLGALLGMVLGSSVLFTSTLPAIIGFVALTALAIGFAATARPIEIPIAPANLRSDGSSALPAQDTLEPLLQWILIAGGSFVMGSNEDRNESPPHRVTVSTFECMNIPVTRRLYFQVLGGRRMWVPETLNEEFRKF